ncbi:hypothetical protein [Clostridium sp. E02]|uniref:hypothetical protein n=1 Tax=Clostridium sp. E02 TaxID=2487134 RepID=UPI000F5465E8|nr:hypothetical protein [Clostridium sp. E02]
MELPDNLKNQGYSIQNVTGQDLEEFKRIRRASFKQVIDLYNGGWLDQIQDIIGTDLFHRLQMNASFQKILKGDTTIGFLFYKEQPDQISEFTILMLQPDQNQEIIDYLIDWITGLSQITGKPVLLMVYQTDSMVRSYLKHGFKIYDTSRTHHLMSYNQENPAEFWDYKNRIYSGRNP